MELITRAVIMAGGEGTRLRPHTAMTPKPMLQVDGVPLLYIMIEKLHSFGINHFYLSVNYLSRAICDYFGDGSKFGIRITYIREPYAMGTAGSISMVDIQEPFLVINGDIYTNLDFRDFFVRFRLSRSDLFICCREEILKSKYGIIHYEDGKVTSWIEKPEYRHYITCGIYVFRPVVIKCIPKEHYFGMDHLATKMMEEGVVSYYIMPDEIDWVDIGTIHEFERVKEILTERS